MLHLSSSSCPLERTAGPLVCQPRVGGGEWCLHLSPSSCPLEHTAGPLVCQSQVGGKWRLQLSSSSCPLEYIAGPQWHRYSFFCSLSFSSCLAAHKLQDPSKLRVCLHWTASSTLPSQYLQQQYPPCSSCSLPFP